MTNSIFQKRIAECRCPRCGHPLGRRRRGWVALPGQNSLATTTAGVIVGTTTCGFGLVLWGIALAFFAAANAAAATGPGFDWVCFQCDFEFPAPLDEFFQSEAWHRLAQEQRAPSETPGNAPVRTRSRSYYGRPYTRLPNLGDLREDWKARLDLEPSPDALRIRATSRKQVLVVDRGTVRLETEGSGRVLHELPLRSVHQIEVWPNALKIDGWYALHGCDPDAMRWLRAHLLQRAHEEQRSANQDELVEFQRAVGSAQGTRSVGMSNPFTELISRHPELILFALAIPVGGLVLLLLFFVV